METIYISGRMTGIKDLNYKKFEKYDKKFKELGYKVENPHEFKENKQEQTWENYMKNDIIRLLKCDAVAILDDWWLSEGSKLEILIAHKLGLRLIYAETMEEFEFSANVKFKLKEEEVVGSGKLVKRKTV